VCIDDLLRVSPTGLISNGSHSHVRRLVLDCDKWGGRLKLGEIWGRCRLG
jgi:hypothetical protein